MTEWRVYLTLPLVHVGLFYWNCCGLTLEFQN